MVKDKNASSDRDKIPITSVDHVKQELATLRAALAVKETEHSWEGLDRAFKRFTAVTCGGACKYEDIYLAGLKDRELAKAINGCLATERTQLSASVLLFISAATRLGHLFLPLLPLYLPTILRLLSRTNKLYVSRSTACVSAIIRNTRLANVIPYLREGMDEKAASHRRGCITALLCLLGGEEPVFNGILVDKELVMRKYTEDVEKMIKIGATDKDIEVRKLAKTCWQIYRSEFTNRIEVFAAPLTPIIRKYLELPPPGVGIPLPPLPSLNLQSRPAGQAAKFVRPAPISAASTSTAPRAPAQNNAESRPASRTANTVSAKAAPALSKSSGPSLSAKLEAMRQPLYPLSLSTSSSSTRPIHPLPISRSVSSSVVPPSWKNSESSALLNDRHTLARSVTVGSSSMAEFQHSRQASAPGTTFPSSTSATTDDMPSTSSAPTRRPFQTNFSPAVALFTGSASAAAVLSAQSSPQEDISPNEAEQMHTLHQTIGSLASAHYQQQARRAPVSRPPMSHHPTSRAGRVLAPAQSTKPQAMGSDSAQSIQATPTESSSTGFVPSKRSASALSTSSMASASSVSQQQAEGSASRTASSNPSRPTSASSQEETPANVAQATDNAARPESSGAQAPTAVDKRFVPQKSQRGAFRPARPPTAPSIPSSSHEPGVPKRMPSSNTLKASIPAGTTVTQAPSASLPTQSSRTAGPVPSSFRGDVAKARYASKAGEGSKGNQAPATTSAGPPAKRQAISSSTSTKPTAASAPKPAAPPVSRRPVHPSSGGSIFSRLTAPTASSTARAKAVSKETIAKKKEKETFQKPMAKSTSQRSLALKASVSRKAPDAKVEEASGVQEAHCSELPTDDHQQFAETKDPEPSSRAMEYRPASPELSQVHQHVRETTLEIALAQPLPPSPVPSDDGFVRETESPTLIPSVQGQENEEGSISRQSDTQTLGTPLYDVKEPETPQHPDEAAHHENLAATEPEVEGLEEQSTDEVHDQDKTVSTHNDQDPEEPDMPITSSPGDFGSGAAEPKLTETRHVHDDIIISTPGHNQPAARSTTPTEVPPLSSDLGLPQDLALDEENPAADATLLLADSAGALISEIALEPDTAALEAASPGAHPDPHLLDQSEAVWSAFSAPDTEGDVALLLEEQPSQRAWYDDSITDHNQQVPTGDGCDDERTTVFGRPTRSTDESADRAVEANQVTDKADLPLSHDDEDNKDEEEEEDDVALLISRELSDDSLEELASRFDHSLVGPLQIGDDDVEPSVTDDATPMRIRSTQFLPESWLNIGDAKDGLIDDEDATQILTMSIKAPRTLQGRKDKLTLTSTETPTRIRSPLQAADVNAL